jgi:hypothetical protein
LHQQQKTQSPQIVTDVDIMIKNIETTTKRIGRKISRMVYDTEDSDAASSYSVSGIILTRNIKKTTQFLLLQQQEKRFEGQTTTNQSYFFNKTTVYCFIIMSIMI